MDTAGSLVALAAGVVEELRVLLAERERHVPEPAVAVLGDEHVREPLVLGLVLVVVLVAADEHDEVCVLLDLARFTKVGEDRLLVVALLDGAGELRKRDDWNAQLAGEDLQASAHLTDLLDAVVRAGVRPQELEVVDDDQPEAALVLVLGVQPARLRADVQDADVRRVVDEERSGREPLRGLEDPRPLGVGDLPLAELVAEDPPLARDEAL